MPPELASLMQQFHDAVTGVAPLASARAIVRHDGVDPIARLAAYAHAYHARIAGVLATDYPKLRALLGAAAFDALVVPYLRAYPTRSFSLREAGAHLPAFLDEPHAIELARLERARVEAFDGADARPVSRDDLAALDPEQFPQLVFALVPTAVAIAMTTNADAIWSAIEDDGDREPPAVESATRTVLVWRRETTVVHRTLDADEARALELLRDGASFGVVCEALATPERALELLVRWLDAGLLVLQ